LPRLQYVDLQGLVKTWARFRNVVEAVKMLIDR